MAHGILGLWISKRWCIAQMNKVHIMMSIVTIKGKICSYVLVEIVMGTKGGVFDRNHYQIYVRLKLPIYAFIS